MEISGEQVVNSPSFPVFRYKELLEKMENPNVDEAVEMAEKEALRAKEAEQRAEEESQKTARLAAKLREMGIDPESL